jgi:hypothetical protein
MEAVGNRSQDHRLLPTGDACEHALSTCTLRDVVEMADVDSIALFKCDIEGSEYDVFANARSADIRRVDLFAIEYHDNLRPRTLALLQRSLAPAHKLRVKPARNYGMIYAKRR